MKWHQSGFFNLVLALTCACMAGANLQRLAWLSSGFYLVLAVVFARKAMRSLVETAEAKKRKRINTAA